MLSNKCSVVKSTIWLPQCGGVDVALIGNTQVKYFTSVPLKF